MSSLNQLKGKLCFPSENYVLLLKGDEVSLKFVDSLPVGELCSPYSRLFTGVTGSPYKVDNYFPLVFHSPT